MTLAAERWPAYAGPAASTRRSGALAVYRMEPPRRGKFAPGRRLGLAQNHAFKQSVPPWGRSVDPFGARRSKRGFDELDCLLAGDDEVTQALLDRPACRIRLPIELRFVEARRKLLRLSCNCFKLFAICLVLGFPH